MEHGHVDFDFLWMCLTIVLVVLIVATRRHLAERERQATLRIALERGAALDPAVLQRLLTPPPRSRSPRALLVGGLVTTGFGVGLALLGVFLSSKGGGDADALPPLLGSGSLFACVGIALLIAARLVRRDAPPEPTEPGV